MKTSAKSITEYPHHIVTNVPDQCEENHNKLPFWVSLVPLVTACLGNYYRDPRAVGRYGAVLFLCSPGQLVCGFQFLNPTLALRRAFPRYNPQFAVRILLLSDIHSNLEGLEACLAAAPAHDKVVNLGDTVGYGANPNEVIARAKPLGNVFVRGNHDKAVSGLMDLEGFNPVAGLATLWTRDQLTRSNLEWLRSLPQGPVSLAEVPGVQFVHGSALDEDEYTVSVRDAIAPLITNPVPITFFGHTHLQGGFSLQGEIGEAYRPGYRTVGQPESSDWPLRRERRYLINPGSVGQPRDGDWRAGFAVFDSEAWIVSFYRVPYNVRVAQEKILAANLPPRLATRLATGR